MEQNLTRRCNVHLTDSVNSLAVWCFGLPELSTCALPAAGGGFVFRRGHKIGRWGRVKVSTWALESVRRSWEVWMGIAVILSCLSMYLLVSPCMYPSLSIFYCLSICPSVSAFASLSLLLLHTYFHLSASVSSLFRLSLRSVCASYITSLLSFSSSFTHGRSSSLFFIPLSFTCKL